MSCACAVLPPRERVRIPSLARGEQPIEIAALQRLSAQSGIARERIALLGGPLETVVYPAAYHGFDALSGRIRLRTDVRTGAAPGKGVHVGPDPGARVDANRRVDAFLRDQLVR